MSIYYFVLLSILVYSQQINCYEIKFKDAHINKEFQGIVNSDVQYVYRFTIPPTSVYTSNSYIRVEFNASFESNGRCPIHLVIRQANHVQTIDLPQKQELTNLTVYAGARTICLANPEDWSSIIFVTVSSCSKLNVRFSFSLSLHDGFNIKIDERKTVHNVSATAPILYHFKFPEHINFVTIIANSTSISRTFLSIQPTQCPVHDELSNIKFTGHWHTMSRLTSLVVQKKTYPNGFFMIFLPAGREESDPRIIDPAHNETISFIIVSDEDTEIFKYSLLIPILIYFVVIIVVFIIYSYCHHINIKPQRDTQLAPQNFQCFCHKNHCDTTLRVIHFTTDENLYKYLRENSYRYIWTILTIVFFYGFPVILLTLTLTHFSEETGDLDICNFNYFCSYPIWIFVSFNHVFSSLGFVILGLTFIVLVHLRATSLEVNEEGMMGIRDDDMDQKWICFRFRKIQISPTGYGAYQNFGTFYALGFALTMVGIMKMTYNTCPSRDTTFFGLTFLFILVLLCQIKIFSLRHPCMITDNFTFVSIGIVIGTITVGYLSQNLIVQIVVSVFISFWIQLTILILHSAGYAFNANSEPESLIDDDVLNDDVPAEGVGAGATLTRRTDLITSPTGLFAHVFCSCNIIHLFYPELRRRIFWPILRLLLNVGILSLIWLKMTENDFTTRMYVLVLANFLLDLIYYFIILKCCHEEYFKKTSWQPVCYLFCGGVLWITSHIYLAESLGAWELPSILFQEKYTSCTFGIYDTLDMYYWLAAASWFFIFMGMLTADDPLSRISTEMTAVF